jgi:NAD+ diphosphatase
VPDAPLTYTGAPLDRAGAHRKDPAWVAARLDDEAAVVVPMAADRSLVANAAAARLAAGTLRDLGVAADDWVLLGVDDTGAPVFAAELEEALRDAAGALVDGAEFVELRRATPSLPLPDAALLAYARGILGWHRRHRHCGVCGTATASRHAGHMRQCTNPACGAETYPRTDPAVIMLVERHAAGEPPTCLLAHHGRLAPGMFSTLAGFVEPGESLEEAVAREVLEETGVRVSSVRYVGSQPWPFPASLMIGFRAVAESTEVTIDPDELTEARWFTAAEVRAAGEWGDPGDGLKLPRRDSIARRLVDGWLADVRPD